MKYPRTKKQKATIIFLLFLFLSIFFYYTIHIALAQSFASPQPPVNIEFIVPDNPKANERLALTLKVTSQVDIHADVSCLLPSGVEAIHEKGIRIKSYLQKDTSILKDRINPKTVISLWAGSMKAGKTKEFIYHIRIAEKGSYQLVCIFDALAQWGKKEEAYIIEIK